MQKRLAATKQAEEHVASRREQNRALIFEEVERIASQLVEDFRKNFQEARNNYFTDKGIVVRLGHTTDKDKAFLSVMHDPELKSLLQKSLEDLISVTASEAKEAIHVAIENDFTPISYYDGPSGVKFILTLVQP